LDDDCYEIDGDSDWVLKNIPNEIDDAFGISDSMELWEDEEEEEDGKEET
jgi:hypothetical protein